MLPDEKVTALLDMFKDAPGVLDDLLLQAEASATTWTGKEQVKQLRARIRTKEAAGPDWLGVLSEWMTTTKKGGWFPWL